MVKGKTRSSSITVAQNAKTDPKNNEESNEKDNKSSSSETESYMKDPLDSPS